MEDDVFYCDMDINLVVHNGDVFIDGKFISQLCYTPEGVGNAVAMYIRGITDDGCCDDV